MTKEEIKKLSIEFVLRVLCDEWYKDEVKEIQSCNLFGPVTNEEIKQEMYELLASEFDEFVFINYKYDL